MKRIRSNATKRWRILAPFAGGAALIAFQLAWSAEDRGARALQQHQLQRQQQEEATQLRQLQQQRAAQSPPSGVREQARQFERELQQESRK